MQRWLPLVGIVLLGWFSRGWAQSNARHAGYLYLSPVPGASYVSPQTRYVLIRFASMAPSQVTNLTNDFVTVIGKHSGRHAGTTRIASDGRTVVFELVSELGANELVSVNLKPLLGNRAKSGVERFRYQFMTSDPMPGSFPPALASGTQLAVDIGPNPQTAGAKPLTTAIPRTLVSKAAILANGVSVPSDFPQVAITTNYYPSPGNLFLENALDEVPPYTMILNEDGLPVWYQRGRLADLKVQNDTLTYCRLAASGEATYSVVDHNFNPLHTYVAVNGYLTDGHDLKILPDGRYFLLGYRENPVNMAHYITGGTNAVVVETVVQEFTPASELIFQWRSWDNYDIRDLVPTGNTDLAHLNGLDIDDDGNLLVSARHLSEITKVDLDSGDILWRLGGAHGSFVFVNDSLNGPGYQHNISALGKGHYLLFDNGDNHHPPVSRAVEYAVDLTNRIARLVWQFRDSPDKFTGWMGSAQRLSNGNTLINFVLPRYPKAIEVDNTGAKRFELSLFPGSDAYRAFRFLWHGTTAAPYLLVEPHFDNITLLFNKFGDTNVARYRIYGGTAPHPRVLLAESPSPLKQLFDLSNGLHYFRVTSVNRAGIESPFSNEESVDVNIISPGENMVQNGDFAAKTNAWFFMVNGGAAAEWTIRNGVAQFHIVDGGTSSTSIELLQAGATLLQGSRYVLQFDAWADQSRSIQAQLVQNGSAFIDYSTLAATQLTPNRTHYRYAFTMQQPSDSPANLLFQLGGPPGKIFLTGISLSQLAVGD
ncbi:MAG TPA: aryl-sulfate sulfotransferase [Verrucomicrobiae bacterium]|nr:aryl-sulfate sulfotransferase [Verrucomicrobiae bacterium]